ncbi:MAG TPA: ergothioneine biosynthesis protein EgtB, partial [Balneola sp.]|nr:ergothioneine biosynthesis protein EgtB [Balneola sp.]
MSETQIKSKEQDSRFSRESIEGNFNKVRAFTHHLVEPLEIEDFVIQPMENTSPTKWHLAHTSWFFETFVLEKFQSNFESLHPQYAYFFNSYYLQTGVPFSRAKRGLLSRPTVKEVFEYREYVNDQVSDFINSCDDQIWEKVSNVLEIGINHEQQHQE